MSFPRVSAVLLATALSIATGCRHEAAETVPSPFDASAAHVAAVDAEYGEDFSGDFSTEGVHLVIGVDGRYRLHEGTGPAASEGLWSLEPGSGQLLLVPHAADEPRRRYAMPSPDELAPEDGGPSLHRGPLAATR